MADGARVTQSGTETRQRRHIAQMRCNDAEWAQLQLAAERAGMDVAPYMRQRCLSGAVSRAARRPPVERAALAQLLGHLGKCGSNLNQIARVLNARGDTPGDIPQAVAEVRAAAVAIMQLLGRGTA